MTHHRMKIRDAALLLDRHYATITARETAPGLAALSPDARAQAALTDDGILLVPGSDGLADYLTFNLRPGFLARPPAAPRLTHGVGSGRFHGGFLRHAKRVHDWLAGRRPRFIVGHSLGAASAQILGRALGVPTIGFASPQVYHGAPRGRWPGEGWVLNVVWKLDYVTEGFKTFRLRTLGSIIELNDGRRNRGIDHRMEDYIRLVSDPATVALSSLPADWPSNDHARRAERRREPRRRA